MSKKIVKLIFIGLSILFIVLFIILSIEPDPAKMTHQERIEYIDKLYSKIYSKTEVDKGQGWVEYEYKDKDGKTQSGIYYDKDKSTTTSNYDEMMSKIERYRFDMPELINVTYNDQGLISWDPISIEFPVEYDVYIDGYLQKRSDNSLPYYKLLQYQLKERVEVKIVASEKYQKYYHTSEYEFKINFELVTVTIYDVTNTSKEVKVVKNAALDLSKYTTSKFSTGKMYYDNLRTLECPSAVIITEDTSFYEGGNDYYIKDGVLMNVFAGYQGEFVIPDGVTKIAQKAFKNCNYITKVVIDKKISLIDRKAFESLTSLKEVIITGDVDRIAREAFYNCNNVIYYYVGKGVYKIEDKAFYDTRNNGTLPILVSEKIIGYGCLVSKTPSGEKNCTVIDDININEFYYDDNVAYKIDKTTNTATLLRYLKTNVSVYNILKTITVDNVEYNVTSIGDSAFYFHTELKEIYATNITYCGSDPFGGTTVKIYFGVSNDKGFMYDWDRNKNITVVWGYNC